MARLAHVKVSRSRLSSQGTEVFVDHLSVSRRHVVAAPEHRPGGVGIAKLSAQSELEFLEALHDRRPQSREFLGIVEGFLGFDRPQALNEAVEVLRATARLLQIPPKPFSRLPLASQFARELPNVAGAQPIWRDRTVARSARCTSHGRLTAGTLTLAAGLTLSLPLALPLALALLPLRL